MHGSLVHSMVFIVALHIMLAWTCVTNYIQLSKQISFHMLEKSQKVTGEVLGFNWNAT